MVRKATTFFLTILLLLIHAVAVAAADLSTSLNCADAGYLDLRISYSASASEEADRAGGFSLIIDQPDVPASDQNMDTMPVFSPAEYSLHFQRAQENAGNMVAEERISLPAYSGVGTYTYRMHVRPAAANSIGYTERPVILTVLVTNCPEGDGDLDRSCFLEYEDRPGEKLSCISIEITTEHDSGTGPGKSLVRTGSTAKTNSVKTGDESPLLFWHISLLSGLLFFYLVFCIKRTKGGRV